MADGTTTQVLRIEVDRRSSRQAATETERLSRTVVNWRDEVKAAARDLGALRSQVSDYSNTVRSIIQRGNQLERTTERVGRAYKAQRKEIEATERAERELVRAQRDQAGLVGDVESRTRAITGAVGFVGGEAGAKVERTVNVGAEVLASVEAIQLLSLELPELVSNLNFSTRNVAAFGAATIAVGAAVLVAKDQFEALARGAQATQTAVVGIVDGTRNFYDFLADATTQDADQRRQQILEERRLNELLAQDLRAVQIAIENGLDVSDASALDAFAEGTLKLLDATGLLNFGLDDVKGAIAETTAQTQALDTEFRLLVGAYTDGSFALNDQRAAAEAAAEAERDLVAARGAQLLADTRTQIQAAQLSEDQAKRRLNQIEIERRFYGALITDLTALTGSNAEYAKALEQAQAQVDALTREEAILSALRFEQVRATSAFSQVFGTVGDAVAEALQTTAAVAAPAAAGIARVNRLLAAQATVDTDRALDATREQEDFLRQRTLDLSDHYAELADLDSEFYADRADILADTAGSLAEVEQDRVDEVRELNQDLADLARDNADNQRRIQRDLNRDTQRAAARLDALAIREARINAEDAIEDQQTQYEREKDERERQFAERLGLLSREEEEALNNQREQLRILEDKHRQERAANIAAFNEELRREDQERAIKLQRQAEDFAREDAARRAHFGVVEADYQAHYAALQAVNSAGLLALRNDTLTRVSTAPAAPTALSSATFATRSAAPVAAAIPASSTPFIGPVAPNRTLSTAGQMLVQPGAVTVNVPGSSNPTLTAQEIRREIADFFRLAAG